MLIQHPEFQFAASWLSDRHNDLPSFSSPARGLYNPVYLARTTPHDGFDAEEPGATSARTPARSYRLEPLPSGFSPDRHCQQSRSPLRSRHQNHSGSFRSTGLGVERAALPLIVAELQILRLSHELTSKSC